MDRVTTILRTILALMAFVYLGAGSLAAAGLQSSGPVPSHESDYQAPLDRYCATCHNEQLKTGGLVLRALDVTKAGERPEVWEKVVKKLRTGAMPPVGMPPRRRPGGDVAVATSTGGG